MTNSDPLLLQVGRLLLAWGHLEGTLNLAIVQLQWFSGHKETRPSDDFDTRLKARLEKWRRIHAKHGDPARLAAVDKVKLEITSAAIVRHNLCHGFNAVANPPLQAVCAVREYGNMMDNKWSEAGAFYSLDELRAETDRADNLSREVFRLSTDLQAALSQTHQKGG